MPDLSVGTTPLILQRGDHVADWREVVHFVTGWNPRIACGETWFNSEMVIHCYTDRPASCLSCIAEMS